MDSGIAFLVVFISYKQYFLYFIAFTNDYSQSMSHEQKCQWVRFTHQMAPFKKTNSAIWNILN
jgi:hypothetical protein